LKCYCHIRNATMCSYNDSLATKVRRIISPAEMFKRSDFTLPPQCTVHRSALFRVVSHRVGIILYRRLATSYRSHLQKSRMVPQDGTDRLFLTVSKELPLHTAQQPRRTQISCSRGFCRALKSIPCRCESQSILSSSFPFPV
jgi:hypothetical protein